MVDNKDYKIIGIVGIGAFILALLLVPLDTSKHGQGQLGNDSPPIFLFNGNNQTPKPCNGNQGLVLAQNLTDLCDVTIISPMTNQLIKYNGTQWVNVNFSVFNESTTCTNVGTGTAFVCIEGTNVHVRSISGTNGISVSNNTNTITISGSSLQNQETTVCTGQSGNFNLVASSNSGNCNFKNLLSGSSISLSSNSTHVTITNTSPESTVCSNGGHGAGNIILSSSGGNCSFKGVASGTGITITQNGTDIIVTNSAIDQLYKGANTVSSNFQLWKNDTTVGSTTTHYFRTITNTTGISMTNTSDTITIGNSGVISNSCTAPIVCSGVNPSSISFADSPYWQKLCLNTGSGSTVSCSGFAGKKQLFVQISFNVSSTGTAIVPALQFNTDSGSNYAWRNSFNGGADSTGVTSSSCAVIGSNTVGNSGGGIITVTSDMNQANLRKVMWINEVHGIETNSGTAPTHSETGCKWSNTSAQITTITLMISSGTATYSTGTEITVWGHD